MKAYYYINSRNQEVLHLPHVFVVDLKKKVPEVTLEPERLKTRYSGLKRSKVSLERGLICCPDIEQEDIDVVTYLCFNNQIKEAESYCVDIFDCVSTKLEEGRLKLG